MMDLFKFDWFDSKEDRHAEASREGQVAASRESGVSGIMHTLIDLVKTGIPIPESEDDKIRERAYHHQAGRNAANRESTVDGMVHGLVDLVKTGIPIPETEEDRIRERGYHEQRSRNISKPVLSRSSTVANSYQGYYPSQSSVGRFENLPGGGLGSGVPARPGTHISAKIVFFALFFVALIAVIYRAEVFDYLHRRPSEINLSTTSPPTNLQSSALGTRLLPIDEADRVESFAQFRRQLLDAIDRKDVTFLSHILSPTIVGSFGDGPRTAQEFVRAWRITESDSQLWAELDKVLKMGGAFVNFGGKWQFIAPYVSGSWPKNVDCFTHCAVIAQSAPLLTKPLVGAKSITALSYELVAVHSWSTDRKWVRVSTLKGITGYVSGDYLRSPIDLRAVFEYIDGKWVMVDFVAGD